MLNNILQFFYNKIFINIILKKESIDVYVEVVNKSGVIDKKLRSFDSTVLDPKIIKFISLYQVESPFYYISILDNTIKQGAIATCKKDEMQNYINVSNKECICVNEEWTYYTPKSAISELKESFSDIGLDFIFSPFTILSKFFKDKINGKIGMYILVEEIFLTLAIFEDSKLLFASHILVDNNTADGYDNMIKNTDDELLDDSVNLDLDDVNTLDELDELDDFGDIEDLDGLNDFDDFDDVEDMEEKLEESSLEDKKESTSTDGFSDDYQRFSLIQSALNYYYNNELYDSQFIENVYIADSIGLTNDLKTYIEEDMFLKVFIRNINISDEVCNLAKAELK